MIALLQGEDAFFLKMVAFAIVFDTLMGILRAIKEKKLNSGIGINGAIRKAGMLLSMFFFYMTDKVVHLNLIGFIPEELYQVFGYDKAFAGTATFFGLLFISYEIVSILKNMTLAGLPVQAIWKAVKKFLNKWTTELPDED